MCPNVTGTELVYDGLTAGIHFSNQGGAANYICAVKGADAEYHPEATTQNSNHAALFAQNMKHMDKHWLTYLTTTFPVLCVRSPLAPSIS